MKISITTQVDQAVTIQPLLQTEELAQKLSLLAASLNLPAETLQQDFKAEAKEVLPIYSPDGRKTFLLGLGKEPGALDWIKIFREFFFRNKTRLTGPVAVDLTEFTAETVENIVQGIFWGGYDLRLYVTDKPAATGFFAADPELVLVLPQERHQMAQKAADRALALATTHREILDLLNAPSNYQAPQTLADWAAESGRKHGYSVTVFDKAEIERQGLHALLAVNRGSDLEPRFIILEYRPEGVENPKKVGLVGKGITFDTGGISIKPSTNMHLMKSDMGGAAAVLGTLEAAAKLKLPVHLVGLIPSTENMVDGSATKPGDVIGSYLGKTIEVIDTDAEGRIILADGLGYAIRNFQPDVLIDLATLTGNVIAALGYHAAGLFSQNDQLSADLLAASERTGERLWRLPIWDVYKEDIKSDVADLKNYSGKPFAGAISAAKFLEVFTENHPAWAHLDIAGMAYGDTEFGSQKNGTGFGIRLLIDFLGRLG